MKKKHSLSPNANSIKEPNIYLSPNANSIKKPKTFLAPNANSIKEPNIYLSPNTNIKNEDFNSTKYKIKLFIKSTLLYVILLLLAFNFFDCFSVTKDFPEKKSFLLELKPSDVKNRSMPKEWNVKLRKVSVSSKYLDKSFVYRRSDSKYESDFYNEFLISPQQNLSEELVQYLDASGAFLSTSDMNSRIEASHYIEADFTELFGDFREVGSPKSSMEVQLRVFDDRTAEYTPIFRKNYSKSIPMKDKSPESLVEGWNQALAEICNDFIKDSKNWKEQKVEK